MDSSVHAEAPLGAFLLCLDLLVQHAYALLRDQLKRRLTPLLAECVSPDSDLDLGSGPTGPQAADGTTAAAAAAAAGDEGQIEGQGQPLSPSTAGAAVAGAAAESHAHAEAALMNYRRCVAWVQRESLYTEQKALIASCTAS
jgi:hypothetical protein